MMEKMLIEDYIPFVVAKESINESLSGDGPMRVKGVLQKAGVKNQNGRVYPFEILKREVDKYDQDFIKQKRAVGELDHPDSEVVNLKNVSHNIIRTWWEDKNLMGEIEVLSTPSGNILKELFKCGITLGISSRGSGTVKKVNESTVEVNNDYSLICWDFVSNPSTPGAFMFQNSVNESVTNKEIINKWANVENLIREILSEIK